MAKMSTLTDSFAVNDLASLWSHSYGTLSVSGGQCAIRCDTSYSSGLQSTATYDLTGSSLSMKISPYVATSGNTGMEVQTVTGTGATQYAQIAYSGTILEAQLDNGAGVVTVGSTTYSATAHAWWRIRESGGTIYFGVSANGTTWTDLWSTAYTIPVTALYAYVWAGDFGTDPAGTTYVTLVNVPQGVPYLIQSAPGSLSAPSGIGTTAITTSAGSFLAAFIGWNNVTPGTSAPVPSVSVTDSAGNLWQQCALTRAGTASTRAAVWCAANALPVTWISAGLSGNAASASWIAAEIGGMPQDVQPDFSVSASSGGTAPSLSWQASQLGVGLAVLGAGNSAETVTSPPAGWTAVGTATAAGGTAGTQTFAWMAPFTVPGTAVTALALGTAASWSYALCSLKAAASPPPQNSQFFPRTVVDAAFGARPGDFTASQDWLFSDDYTTWTNITVRVLGPNGQGRIKTSRGRPYQLQQQEAGQMSATLANWDGAFTPTNPGSFAYSNALNANMSFQSSVSPWSGANGASVAQSASAAFASGLNASASYSAQVTCGTAAAPGIVSELVPVNPNYPYSFSAWLYAGSAVTPGGQAGVAWYTAAQSLISTAVTLPVALAAGQWAQAVLPNQSPPSGAAYAQVIARLAGIPGAGSVFSVAEAALAAGPQAVRTGLVAPMTPVRVTGWWQGRRYPVWSGYAQQWPQEWPDMPQFGFSTLRAADALAVAGAGRMQSALIGEVLSDSPYAYLPCSESYTSQVNGATPSNPFVFTGGYFQPADANGLTAVNQAAGNQVTGTYLDGSTVQASTGVAMNFLGDSGTGMGATSYNGEVSGQRGPSMLYADPGLSAVFSSAAGYTLEFWFTWSGTSSQNVTLLTVYSAPSAFMAPVGSVNGASLGIAISGGNLFVYLSSGASYLIGAVAQSQGPQHVALIAPPSGQLTVTLNGAAVGFTPNPGITSVSAVVLGPGRYSYDCNNAAVYAAYNFSAGHLAVYGYQLPFWRITAHYQAGSSGWSGTDAGTRFSQVMTWARLGMKRGGYNKASATGNAEPTQAGPAYSLSGQSANSALYALSQSEGGVYRTQGNGSLVYVERPAGYNLPVSAVFADGTAAAPSVLNADPGFAAGLAGWTASGGSVSYAPGNRYGSLGSLLVTPSGGAATAASPSFAYSGGSAQAGFWVNCAAGGTVTCGAVTAAGTASAAAAVSAGAWTFVPVAVPAGTGVTSAVLTASGGTAAFLLAYAAMWNSPGQVPYDPKSSYGFDMTYLYNEVTATQQYGPNSLAVYDARGTASQAQYFRRAALSFSPNVVSPYDASDVTTWSLAGYQQPSLRAATVTVNAATNPLAAFPVVLSHDQGQAAQVNRAPVGGAPLTEAGITQKVEHDIGPGFWRASYQVSPYGPGQAVLSADTPGYDAPGTASSLTLPW